MKLFRDLVGALGVVIVVLALLGSGLSYGEDYQTNPCVDGTGGAAVVTCAVAACIDAQTTGCTAACGGQNCDNRDVNCKCYTTSSGCSCRRR